MAKKIEIKSIVVEDGASKVELMPAAVQALIQGHGNDIRKAVRAMFGKISDSRMGIQDVLICLSSSYAMVLNQAKHADRQDIREAFKKILQYTDPELFPTEEKKKA